METDKCATAYCRKPVILVRTDPKTKDRTNYCEECNDRRLSDKAQAWTREHPGYVVKDGFILKGRA